jgi:hypothetical protein
LRNYASQRNVRAHRRRTAIFIYWKTSAVMNAFIVYNIKPCDRRPLGDACFVVPRMPQAELS